MSDSFPRQYARTQRFTLGEPRNISVSPDGRRIVFLRSSAGDDPANSLWVMDAEDGTERLVADTASLLGDDSGADLPPEERARRERAREGAGGITGYATDAATTVAAFSVAGRLFVAGLMSGAARELPVEGPVFDPRPDPPARRVAYVSGRTLRIGELNGRSRVIAGGEEDSQTVSWGGAEFIAAEEMRRFRGYWWSPDGSALAVCRVDTAAVDRWTIADPAQPANAPTTVHYPAAGTANADVTLHIVDLEGGRREVRWARDRLPYLAAVDWNESRLVIQVQTRDQRETQYLRVDPATGATDAIAVDRDEDWVELVPGCPATDPEGRLVRALDHEGVRRLFVGDEIASPENLQVRSVVAADSSGVTFQANDLDDPMSLHVWRRSPDGELTALTDEPGIHSAAVGGDTVVVRSATLDTERAHVATLDGVQIRSHAAVPGIVPVPTLLRLGEDELSTAVLLPGDHDGSPLPVLVDPYGGPHAQRVVRSRAAHLTPQWFADQGYAVVVCDGRGTPGRGSRWERAVRDDLAGTLDDQVTALEAAAEQNPALDLSRVAIRGWSFGGYLAALAVLRRPDVFHAAIAGAPVTEWRLYDTHYTERYLGDPSANATVYDENSLIPLADDLQRPLLLIHGLADDNVVAAHTLQLSSALLAAGRPHEVLPLSGVTHMTPQEEVAENLLRHQLDFLRRALGGTVHGE